MPSSVSLSPNSALVPLVGVGKPKGAPAASSLLLDLGSSKAARLAASRILGPDADPGLLPIGRGSTKKILLAEGISLSPAGRLLQGGKLASGEPGRGADGALIYRSAEVGAHLGGLFESAALSSKMRARVLAQLTTALDYAQAGARNLHKEKVVSGSLSLLVDLWRSTPASDAKTSRAISDQLLRSLFREPDLEMVAFYLQSIRDRVKSLDPAGKLAFKATADRALPKGPLLEEWTENRTKPLEVRHTVHPEFWKDELKFFSKANGFTLVKKDAKDTRREYTGLIPDPTGKKPPLKVHLVVHKDELDYLEPMSDPEAHVVMYSGHSAVGGNGSQAIQAAGPMRGKYPKLVFAANCRGKDNYAEFMNKYPGAHCIMTDGPTYSDSGSSRIAGMFEMFARGEDYAWMRNKTEEPFWDEPADNYFYPDEWRKFGFMDCDQDGKIDFSPIGTDRLFDVGLRAAGQKFVRALNFTNSELFYHWEVDQENGKKSFYGRKYGDSLVPSGALRDPAPGEVVRVVPKKVTLPSGKKATRYDVRYEAGLAGRMDQNVYAGMITLHTVLALAKEKVKKVNLHEALRAVLMGAQAIHYLDVYIDSAPKTTRSYFAKLGLTKTMISKDVDKIFNAFDAHANNAQVKAFAKLLTDKYKVDLESWFEQRMKALAPTVF